MTGRWEIVIPAPVEIMSFNQDKSKPRSASARRAAWRQTAYAKIHANVLPVLLDRIRVDIEIRFPRASSRRNEVNYHPTVGKPIVDALTPQRCYTHTKGPRKGLRVVEWGCGVIADDTVPPLHCTDCPHITFGAPVGTDACCPYGLVVLTVTDLSGKTSC